MTQTKGETANISRSPQPTQETTLKAASMKPAVETKPVSPTREFKNFIDRFIIVVGVVLFGLSALAMFGFQVYWFYYWWGKLGALVGLLLASLSAVFPFLYLYKEEFSLVYFAVWGAGILGLLGLFAGSRMFDPSPDPPPRDSIN